MEDRKKLQKFAIRKLSMGVGSVLIGLAFIGGTLEPKLVQADETKQVSFHYLAESELTAAERELIHHELPQDLSQESYYLVYRKQGQAVLPQTGSVTFPLAGLGLLTASLVVFLFSKKKPSKIVGVLLIASLGKSLLLPYQVFAFEHKDLLAYDQTQILVSADGLSQGIIDIKGYDYVGYLLESDLRGTGQDLTSSGNSEIPAKPVNQAAIHEIPEFTGGVSGESLVEPTKPTFEGGVNGQGTVAESLPEYTPEFSSQSGIPEVHDKADFTGGVSGESLVEPTKPTFEGGVSGQGTVAESLPEYTPEFSSQSGVPEVHTKPDFTSGVSGDSLVESTKPTFEGGVNGQGTVSEALPDYTPEFSSQSGIPEVHDKPDFTGGVSGESLVESTKPTFEGGVNGQGAVAETLQDYEGGAVPVETLKQEIPDFTGGVSGGSLVEPTKPTFEGGVNGQGVVSEALPEYKPEFSSQSGVPEVHNTPDFTGGVSGDSLVESTKPTFEGGVNGQGTVAESLPEYTPNSSSQSGLPEVHAKPDFTGGVSGESLVEPPKPTFEGDVNGQGAVAETLQDYEGGAVPVETLKQEIPDFTGGVSGDSLVESTKPTFEGGVNGQGTVSEAIPEYTPEFSSQSGIPEVHDKPEFTGGVSGESLVEPTKPTFEGGVNGQGTVAESLPDYEGGAVPVDTLKQELPSYSGGVNATEALVLDAKPTLHIEVRKELIPKQTREKIDPDMLVGETRIEQVGQDGEKEIVTSYEEKDGKRISEPKETTRILTEAKDQVIIRGSKEKEEIKPEPVLTLSNITGNSMGRSARLSYNLDKADGVSVSKISAIIKAKGLEDQTLDLTSDQLEATVDNLKLYTDYTISTRMVYNRGKGEESTLLEVKKLRLELKKLEIKDIKETSLVKVENGKESVIQHLTEVPRNLEDYYLKINSEDHKTSRLAIKSIQTERIAGKEYYKVNAEATDLIQRDDQKNFEEGFSYYLAKSSADSPTIANVKEYAYQDIQDYDSRHDQAYRNLEKLQPFYNKEWIVNQGNKLDLDHNLAKKEVISVIAMKGKDFVTDLSVADHIMVHYADKTKDVFTISAQNSGLTAVKEYKIADLDVLYTPDMLVKDRSALAKELTSILKTVDLQSEGVYRILDDQTTSLDKKVEAVKNWYLEESFAEVKAQLGNLVDKLLTNLDYQWNDSPARTAALKKKVQDNQSAIMLGLAYLNRYYGIRFADYNLKELMLFRPDFYGQNVDVLDRLIELGSRESNLKGDQTHETFARVLAKDTKSEDLHAFLDYNRQLLTTDKDMNDWFVNATKGHVYIAERASKNQEIANRKHRAYDNLNNWLHRNMILPLLNVKKAQMFLISNYNTITFGSADKSGKTIDQMKADIDLVADRQLTYLDFWYRLAADDVKDRMVKSDFNVATPVWEGYRVDGRGWVERYGHTSGMEDYAPIREVFGPAGRYYKDNKLGAYASIYPKINARDAVHFVEIDMMSEYGLSVYTHETTHVNDRIVYLGGYKHREGTYVEAYAQGMLQSPAEEGHQGEYGALGINMAYMRPNDGDQWYNPDPTKLQTRKQIDHYMKGYNEALMLLDYLEGERVLAKNDLALKKAWFSKMTKQMRYQDQDNKLVAPNQWDYVRPLTDEEAKTQLNSVDDLIKHNIITNRHYQGTYRPEELKTAYVNVKMVDAIYGGNTSQGAPGAISFKHNAFRMWGYYGYENGFLGYASNKYKDEALSEGHDTLGDDFIIQKVSKGKFQNLEEWKKAWFDAIITKAKRGIHSFEIDGQQIDSYEKLQDLFDKAVETDYRNFKYGGSVANYTVALKKKVFQKLLQVTDAFSSELFPKG
ncbi:SIALI-17 repeat-containing surface protein [Streptococcus pseudopneumoniae]|uniref:SIALI-17 repeat-containing surface protein n=1 Tax=Streptococcus pseudopneumoniae TaxID=257758 RepID=UPI00066D96DF|nr:SIALI-17 repeat-containing surface protein [Streptococcus pseudopneumoniae]